MNIKQAKEQIQNAMLAYFTKDEYGRYAISIEKQRPVFLIGPPGIGKTAIMEQIAKELDVAFVSYSMTHHTRQSALGLPFITKKTYGGKEYEVSEYTMSEIIASVYEKMEATGKSEGILFLDEINCVSETLAPSMLQFLQYKVFGRHSVPNGWIVVTAGNPPEYNNSVREFDIVTWDRLKRLDVEPDFEVWKEYAYQKGVHPAVITFLETKKDFFYKIESSVDGKSFVTARGWCDLSDMIVLYEKHGIKVDESLVSQYLQNKRIAKEFSVYYDLFNKYRSDYQVDKILGGICPEEIKIRASKAKFDERLTLLGLLLGAMNDEFKTVFSHEKALGDIVSALRGVKMKLSSSQSADGISALCEQINARKRQLESGIANNTLSEENQNMLFGSVKVLEDEYELLLKEKPADSAEAFAVIKKDYDARVQAFNTLVKNTGAMLSNMFRFCEEVFSDGQQMLILVTELTISYYGAHFISRYGCKEYFAHNKELLFYEREKEIISQLERLDFKLD